MVRTAPSWRAFSLVELSIVLVILGLLVGGILSGQSLIRASELRSVVTQYHKYFTVTQTFRDKYQAIPGDFNNAQSFWGVAHATPATCRTTASTTTATCNGDGDNMVDPDWNAPSAGSNEPFRFWQHLVNAGLIEGQYDGVGHGSTTWSATAANSPSGKLSNSGWTASYYLKPLPADTNNYAIEYGNSFTFGGWLAGTVTAGSILRPEEAWNIDTKLDDGKPGTGKVLARENAGWGAGATACTTSTTQTDFAGLYRLANQDVICALYFIQQF